MRLFEPQLLLQGATTPEGWPCCSIKDCANRSVPLEDKMDGAKDERLCVLKRLPSVDQKLAYVVGSTASICRY